MSYEMKAKATLAGMVILLFWLLVRIKCALSFNWGLLTAVYRLERYHDPVCLYVDASLFVETVD